MRKNLKIQTAFFPALIPPLISSELLAFIQIRLSVKELVKKAIYLQDKDILNIPCGQAIDSMASLSSQVISSLFLLLSLGLGLSLTAFFLAWAGIRIVSKEIFISLPSFLLWISLFLYINKTSFLLIPSLWVFFIPLISWKSAKIFLLKTEKKDTKIKSLYYILPLIILMGLFLPILKKDIFMDIRDKLLFSSSLGLKINESYYLHTLSAAEVIKPLPAKQIKTYKSNFSLPLKVEENLKKNYWYKQKEEEKADLSLKESIKNKEEFYLSGEKIKKTLVKKDDFFKNPAKLLDETSLKADAYGPFRTIILLSLLIALPLFLYSLIFALASYLSSLFLNQRSSLKLSSIICLCLSLCLILPLFFKEDKGKIKDLSDLKIYISSQKTDKRIAAIKAASERRDLYLDDKALENSLKSRDIAENYWILHYMGRKNSEKHWKLLLKALEKKQINLQCKAIEALSRSAWDFEKKEEARRIIMQSLKESGHPYLQWYAFQALKRLGPV